MCWYSSVEKKGGKIQERSKEKGRKATFLSPAIQLKRLAKVGRATPSLVQLHASFSVDLCLLSNRRTGWLAPKEFRVLSYASNLVILFSQSIVRSAIFGQQTFERSSQGFQMIQIIHNVNLFWKTGRLQYYVFDLWKLEGKYR